MAEKTKDAIETAATAGLVWAGKTGVAAAALPGLLGVAWTRFQERRVESWWKLVIERAEAADELVAKIEAGLAEDNETVVTGVVGGARAATSAVELSAVTVIAEVSRRYFQQGDLPRWFYRGALEVLERVDATELGNLRRLFVEIKDVPSDSITVLGDLAGDRGWHAFPTSTVEQRFQLTAFSKPARVFSYLKRSGLGFDSSGYGIGGSPNVVVLDREPSAWFREALIASLG